MKKNNLFINISIRIILRQCGFLKPAMSSRVDPNWEERLQAFKLPRNSGKEAYQRTLNKQNASLILSCLRVSLGLTDIPPAQLAFEVFGLVDVNPHSAETILCGLFMGLFVALGGNPNPTKPKEKPTKKTVEQSPFQQSIKLLVDKLVQLKDTDFMTENIVNATLAFANALEREFGSKSIRLPLDNMIETATKFALDQMKSVNKWDAILAGDPLFFGVFNQKKLEQESDHMTIAYGAERKTKMFQYLGQTCIVHRAEQVIEWLDEKTGYVYAYIPVKLVFGEVTVSSHISIHGLPNGGTSYKLNHEHQAHHPYNGTFEDSYESLCLIFSSRAEVGEPFANFDLDGTLLLESALKGADGVFDPMKLRVPDVITPDNLTGLGKLVLKLQMPFRIVTSRNPKGKDTESKLTTGLKTLFPNLVEVSFGANMGSVTDGRDELKAQCKASRINTDLLMFDNEKIVLETVGFGVFCEDNNRTFIVGVPRPAMHSSICLIGPPGSGKTTFAKHLIERFEQMNIDVYYASSDTGEGERDKLPHFLSHMRSANRGRPSVFIYDSTGNSAKSMPFPSISLCQEMTVNNVIGRILSILRRTDHPNLNGSLDVHNVPCGSEWNPAHMTLEQFINYLWKLNNGNKERIAKKISGIGQTLKFSTIGGIDFVISSYKEGLQQWQTPWGVENRKCVLFRNPLTDTWHMLKLGLNAGCEMKPSGQEDRGDSYRNKHNTLQIRICNELYHGLELPNGTVLSGKVDGSLLQITIVAGEFVELLYKAFMQSDDKFATDLIQMTFAMSGGRWFAFMSTNGTIFVPDNMKDYVVTALAGDNPEFSFHRPNGEMFTPEEVWHNHLCGVVANQLATFYNGFTHQSSICTLQFEIVCNNRHTYTGKMHTELAMSYDISMFRFLGVRIGREYIPHYLLSHLAQACEWEEPLFWFVSNGGQALDMLDGLQDISLNVLTVDEFLSKFPPSNTMLPKNLVIDHEGFVILVSMPATDFKFLYGKLKTQLYYMLHKPRESDMPLIMDLLQNCSHETIERFANLSIASSVNKALEQFHRVILAFLLRYIAHQYSVPVPTPKPTGQAEEVKLDPKDVARYNAWLKMADPVKFLLFMYGNAHLLEGPTNDFSSHMYQEFMTAIGAQHLLQVEQQLPEDHLGHKVFDEHRQAVKEIICSPASTDVDDLIRKQITRMFMLFPIV